MVNLPPVPTITGAMLRVNHVSLHACVHVFCVFVCVCVRASACMFVSVYLCVSDKFTVTWIWLNVP